MTSKDEKSCGTIIINHDKVLLIGAQDDEGKMFWSFPKGHQEPGESDTATATRETLEEVGLKVKIIDQNPIVVSHPIYHGTATKYIYLFLAEPKSDKITPQASEVELWKWTSFYQADNYLSGYYKEAWNEAKTRIKSPAS